MTQVCHRIDVVIHTFNSSKVFVEVPKRLWAPYATKCLIRPVSRQSVLKSHSTSKGSFRLCFKAVFQIKSVVNVTGLLFYYPSRLMIRLIVMVSFMQYTSLISSYMKKKTSTNKTKSVLPSKIH